MVTGAASGIGAAVTRLLAADGAGVLAADIDEAAVIRVAEPLRAAGAEIHTVRADVSVEGDVAAMVNAAVEAFGRLDAAINCAGVPSDEDVATHEVSSSEWERVLGVNLTGLWLCMKYEAVAMLRGEGGAIVNVASRAGLKAARHMAAYVASKHGAVGLTKAAALDYADRGIRVNALCPGPIATPMLDRVVAGNDALFDRMKASIPAGRLGTADEVAQCALWLASDAASFVTGVAIAVDGGSMA